MEKAGPLAMTSLSAASPHRPMPTTGLFTMHTQTATAVQHCWFCHKVKLNDTPPFSPPPRRRPANLLIPAAAINDATDVFGSPALAFLRLHEGTSYVHTQLTQRRPCCLCIMLLAAATLRLLLLLSPCQLSTSRCGSTSGTLTLTRRQKCCRWVGVACAGVHVKPSAIPLP